MNSALKNSGKLALSLIISAISVACGGPSDAGGDFALSPDADEMGSESSADSSAATPASAPALRAENVEAPVPALDSSSQQGLALEAVPECKVAPMYFAGATVAMGCDDPGFRVSPQNFCCDNASLRDLSVVSSDPEGLSLQVFPDWVWMECKAPGTYEITSSYAGCDTKQTFKITCAISPLGLPGETCADKDGYEGTLTCGGHGVSCQRN